MLPAIAVLHPLHLRVRDSGAILATIAGTAAVVVGVVGWGNADLRPAAAFLLGMWWWTVGKMWTETRMFGHYLGPVTAALGVLALAGAFFEFANLIAAVTFTGFPQIDPWIPLRLALGAWLIGLAAILPRPNIAEHGR